MTVGHPTSSVVINSDVILIDLCTIGLRIQFWPLIDIVLKAMHGALLYKGIAISRK
jgi:hypothetical protein